MLKKTMLTLALVVLVAGVAAGQDNAPSSTGTAGTEAVGNPIDWFPQFSGPGDVNAYIAATGGNPLTVSATDACLVGDMWGIIGIGLPGPDVQFDVTDGSAEGCACAHSGGYDAAFTTNGTFHIVAVRYVSGADVFAASLELQMRSSTTFQSVQLRGFDACGVV